MERNTPSLTVGLLPKFPQAATPRDVQTLFDGDKVSEA